MFDLAEYMEGFSRPIPWPVLWIGACLGHAFWMTIGLNVLYAWPLPHKLLRFTRKIDLILIGLGPLLFLGFRLRSFRYRPSRLVDDRSERTALRRTP